uniref:Uncharacterized protein n=1 Tax=viral metagenome TaxID=1070528 RepID=A0A6C0BXY1_9ZZZZ
MPVRTRQVHLMDNDEFVNIINDQANLYGRENEINQQYGAPMYSMTAESTPAYIHEPPPPSSATSVSADTSPPATPPATPLTTPPATPLTTPLTTPVATPNIEMSVTKKNWWEIISRFNTNLFNTAVGLIAWYIFKFGAILMFVSFLHWILVSIYVKWCYEPSLGGVFGTIFMVSSPLCGGINNLQQAMSNHFISFWLNGILVSTSFVKGILVM